MTEGETPMDCLIKSLVTMVQVLVLAAVLGGGFGASAVFTYKGTLIAIDKFGFIPVGLAAFFVFATLIHMLEKWLGTDSSREQSNTQRTGDEALADTKDEPQSER